MQWSHGKKVCLAAYRPLINLLIRLRVSPNAITITGTLLLFLPAYYIIVGRHVPAGWLILFIGLLDMVDGTIARERNLVSTYGAFLDSILDRFGDFLIYLACFHYSLGQDDKFFPYLIFATLFFSATISYTRSKAESLGYKTTAGFATREARLFVLFWGLTCENLITTFWILAVFTAGTSIYRIVDVMRKIMKK